MVFWFFVSLLTGLAVLFTLWPLMRTGTTSNGLEQAIAFYEARKVELLRQSAAGEISREDCDAALAEQARGLIALGRRAEHGASTDDAGRLRRRKLAALGLLGVVPAVAVGLYLAVGSPVVPDQPLIARKSAPQTLDLADALAKIEAHLVRNPDDGRGYEVVAPVYLRAGRFADAVRAYRRVIALLGENAPRLADLGESLVAEADGVVTQDARQVFERALALDGGFAKARFYLALVREQGGDGVGALAELKRIEAGLPEGPARMRVSAEIERFALSERQSNSGSTPQGEAGQSVASLPQPERDAAIRAMVEALDSRLNAAGGTPEEWRRLVHSRLVLGQPEAARAALERARKPLGETDEGRTMLKTLADLVAQHPATPTR